MVLNFRRSTYIHGSILNVVSGLINVNYTVYKHLCKHCDKGSASKVLLLSVKQALDEDTDYKDDIVRELVGGYMKE